MCHSNHNTKMAFRKNEKYRFYNQKQKEEREKKKNGN
ncbi:hypothetical protein X975_02097, partial [Stegodyphus mimosarum]